MAKLKQVALRLGGADQADEDRRDGAVELARHQAAEDKADWERREYFSRY